MKKIIPAVKGTRDFYPELMSSRMWLYDSLKTISCLYGYQEYEAPFLETIELYAAKSGEELVKEQSYVFKDRGGDVITLRPELTPSLARMIAQKQNELVFPVRWWSFGPFWRYEKPQKGRSREFFQWNIDLLGVTTPEADAEMISIAAAFLKKVGLSPENSRILVNDRNLMEKSFDDLGFTREMKPVIASLVDKRGKLGEEKWEEYVLEMGISQSQLMGLKELLANKNLWRESEALVRMFAAIDVMGMSDYVEFDANIMRGLLYYTGIVFEAFDTSGIVRRSILGGGRYNNLLADVGGEPLPAVGFAMGDVVINLVLAERGLIPDFELTPSRILMTIFSDETMLESIKLASELRNKGMEVILFPEAIKLNKQFKYADRMGCQFVVVLGPEELINKQVTVKDLLNGDQKVIDRGDLYQYLGKLLA